MTTFFYTDSGIHISSDQAATLSILTWISALLWMVGLPYNIEVISKSDIGEFNVAEQVVRKHHK